ncbi:hypothetical protein LJB68_07695 [bacterium 210820-DFI.6.52]|nr:hypothetical protein [bacterium 210820-DFI.6.52]
MWPAAGEEGEKDGKCLGEMDPPRAVAGQPGDQTRERLAAPLQIDAAPPA